MNLMSRRVFNEFPILEQVSMGLAIIAVSFCLLRAIPTFIDIYKIEKRKS